MSRKFKMKYSTFLRNYKRNVIRKIIRPILNYAYDTYVVIGDKSKLSIGSRVATANTIFNLSSGNIQIGNRTIFSHGVMVVTGTHEFLNGVRISIHQEYDDGSWGGSAYETPHEGRDIVIGEGVFIGAGAIILGNVSIGSHSIIGAGSVVTKSFPPHSIIKGVPAKKTGSTFDLRNSLTKPREIP